MSDEDLKIKLLRMNLEAIIFDLLTRLEVSYTKDQSAFEEISNSIEAIISLIVWYITKYVNENINN